MKSFFSRKSLFLSVLLISSFETKCVAGRAASRKTATVASSKYGLLSDAFGNKSSSHSHALAGEAESDSILNKLGTFFTQKPSKTLQSLIQTLSFQNYKYKKLIQSLSNQLTVLQRQIRLHKEEIKQLRTLLQNQKESKRKRRAKAKAIPSTVEKNQQEEGDEVLTKGQIKQYQKEIQNLNVQIEKLLSIQDELEVLLSKEREKLAALVEENANYKRDISTLQRRIDELQSLQKDTLDLVRVEREYYKKQIELMKEEVEKAKQEGLMAVEEEKLKMRKLVKALAVKEKEEKKKNKKG